MNKNEFKMRYDPESGRYIKKHIYGEGIFSNLASKLFNKTTKELAAKTSKKLAETALIKGSEKVSYFAGKWAGDKIVSILQGKNTPVKSKKKVTFSMEDSIIPIEVESEIQSIPTNSKPNQKSLTDFEIVERMNRLIPGGRLRRKNNNDIMN